MKVCTVGSRNAPRGQTDKHDIANSRYLYFCYCASNINPIDKSLKSKFLGLCCQRFA
jgi:hypothetical protein